MVVQSNTTDLHAKVRPSWAVEHFYFGRDLGSCRQHECCPHFEQVLDEPAAVQSDATVLELQLRAISKKHHGDVAVRYHVRLLSTLEPGG